MFINYSNHPSGSWADNQKSAAQAEYGSITDVPFPVVPVTFTSEAVGQLAETEVRKILKMLQESEDGQNAVMCQGEFSLSYAVIAGLQKAGVRVVSAVSERKTVVKIQDGASVKTSVFRFAGYREYCRV